MSALSSINMASDQVKNRWAGSEFRFALHGETIAQELAWLGVRVRKIAEGEDMLRTGIDAGRFEAARQPLLAEVALLYHALCARREIGIDAGDAGPRIFKVKTARAIGAGGNTVAAADAAMPIHHHNAVVAFPGGLRRTDARAGRIGAMVAKQRNHRLCDGLRGVAGLRGRKDCGVRFGPEPFHFVRAVGNLGNVVRGVAGMDAGVAAILFAAFPEIDDHAPARELCRRCARTRCRLVGGSHGRLASGCKERKSG